MLYRFYSEGVLVDAEDVSVSEEIHAHSVAAGSRFETCHRR